MGICRSILIVLAALLLLPGSALPAQRNACLICHRPHHAEQGNCVGCHRGNDRTNRREIAHHDLIVGRFAHFTLKGSPIVVRGKELLEVLACRRCHVYEKKGNRLATDLAMLARSVGPQAIFDSIRSPVLLMPNFHLDDGQLAALVNAILGETESAGAGAPETARVVHFEAGKRAEENVFVKQCGPCHKLLSERFGGLGSGDTGPNLSGLFSEFYPRTFRGAGPWTQDGLKKWLENPRSVQPAARMKPVRSAADEFELLTEAIAIGPGPHP